MSTDDFVDHTKDSDLPPSLSPRVDIDVTPEAVKHPNERRRLQLPRISVPTLPAIAWQSLPWKTMGAVIASLIIVAALWSWKPWHVVPKVEPVDAPASQATTPATPAQNIAPSPAMAAKPVSVPPATVAPVPAPVVVAVQPPTPEVDPVPMDVTVGTCALGFPTVDRYFKTKATRSLTLGEQGWIRFGFSCVARGYLTGTSEGFALPAPTPQAPPKPVQASTPVKMPEVKPSLATTRQPSQSTKPQAVPEHYPLTKESCVAHADDFDRLGDSAATNVGDRALRELRRGCLSLRLVPPTATVSATASTCTLSGVLVPDDGQALTDLHGVVEIRSAVYRHDAAVQSDGTFTATEVPASASLSLAVRVSHLRDTSVQVQGCPGQLRVAVRRSDVAGAITDKLTGIFHRGSH